MYIGIYGIISTSLLVRGFLLGKSGVIFFGCLNLILFFILYNLSGNSESKGIVYGIQLFLKNLKDKVLLIISYLSSVWSVSIKMMLTDVIYKYLFPLSLFRTIRTLLFLFNGLSGGLNVLLPMSLCFIFFLLIADKIKSSGIVFGEIPMSGYVLGTGVGILISIYLFSSIFTYGSVSYWAGLNSLMLGGLSYLLILGISGHATSVKDVYNHILTRLWLLGIFVTLTRGGVGKGIDRFDDHTIEKIVYQEKEVPIFIEREEQDQDGRTLTQNLLGSAPKKEHLENQPHNENVGKKQADANQADNDDGFNHKNQIIKSNTKEKRKSLIDNELGQYDETLGKKFIDLATEDLLKE